jgi:hypothetical protein
MRNLRLPPWRSLGGAVRNLVTDVSGETVDPILDCLSNEYWIETSIKKITNLRHVTSRKREVMHSHLLGSRLNVLQGICPAESAVNLQPLSCSHGVCRSLGTLREVPVGLLDAFAKLRKTTISFMSVYPHVCPHAATRFPLKGFS